MHSFPILNLNNENVTSLYFSKDKDSVFIGTDDGRIIHQSAVTKNIMGTGNRIITGQTYDNFGNSPEMGSAEFTYAIYNQLIKTNSEGDVVESLITDVPVFSGVDGYSKGIFLSPVLSAGNDFGYWENIIVHQNVPSSANTDFFIRTSHDKTELENQPWVSVYNEKNSVQSISIKQQGQYLQMKIEMGASAAEEDPYVYSLIASYRVKHGVFFFTNKFSLEKAIDSIEGEMVARYSAPDYTEVQFGVTNKNSAEWSDYDILDLNRFQNLDIDKRFKLGIKLISHTTQSPEVTGFSFMFDSGVKEKLPQ